MTTNWFEPRHYKHFDRPVCEGFAKKAMQGDFVKNHSFSPLIHYNKQTKKYKRAEKKTVTKDRPIMYASHRDACILSWYSKLLNEKLGAFYDDKALSEHIIAYRSLGLGNYDFSAAAYKYAVDNSPCMILAFDVTGFFDNLDHKLLKGRLKQILGVASLPEHWLRVLRAVTKFHYVQLDDLKANEKFAEAISKRGIEPIATVAELKAAGITFHPNPKAIAGIPQGTPISATLSNLYLMDFDQKALSFCEATGALYRRYSDDILVICPIDKAKEVEAEITKMIEAEKLQISADKTERTLFDPASIATQNLRSAQYLGFTYYPDGAGIRPSSLSRQWRKVRKAIRRAKKAAEIVTVSGKATKVHTKKLRRRFSPLQFRNFSSYARRSAAAFGKDEKITGQVKRLERWFDVELRKLLGKPPIK